MLVGSHTVATGDVRRVEIDYADWLEHGQHITASVATVLTAGVTSFVSNPVPPENSKKTRAIFFVHAGTVVNESFTVQVQVTDTLGQVVNDTVQFTVLAP